MVRNPGWTDEEIAGDLDPIAQEAVIWFATMHADELTPADREAFQTWMSRDARHRAAYADVERLMSGVAELPAAKERRRAARLKMTRRTFGVAVAAAALGGGGWIISRQHPFADYRTATGERRTITLPDNSRVELSTASALSLDFSSRLRLATLHMGEAFFSVAPDATRPFVVEAAGGRTMAEGTAFNIGYMLDDDVRVTVAEHAVSIRLGTQDVRLDVDTQVVYGRHGIGVPERVDPATELAWRDGRLVFVSAPFGRVIAALNRWRRGKLMVMSDALAARPVTLIVDLEKSGDVLTTLEEALPIRTVNVTPYLTLIFDV